MLRESLHDHDQLMLHVSAYPPAAAMLNAMQAAGGAPQAMPVQAQLVQSMKIPDATEYLSILKSRHSASINPQVEGQITKIFVKSGDHVKTGEVLLQIDPGLPKSPHNHIGTNAGFNRHVAIRIIDLLIGRIVTGRLSNLLDRAVDCQLEVG